jgi:hypothetical protein
MLTPPGPLCGNATGMKTPNRGPGRGERPSLIKFTESGAEPSITVISVT